MQPHGFMADAHGMKIVTFLLNLTQLVEMGALGVDMSNEPLSIVTVPDCPIIFGSNFHFRVTECPCTTRSNVKHMLDPISHQFGLWMRYQQLFARQ